VSATTAGAVKAYMEGLGTGLPVFRDGAPPKFAEPFATVQEGIGIDTRQTGDTGDAAADVAVSELVQVDVYLPARSRVGASTRNAESTTVPDLLHRRLHGATFGPVGGARVYGCFVQSRQRWPITDNVARHTLTLRVERNLQ
jgi:hypothetical protein